MMRTLFLVRHGETDENAAGRTIATTDPPLNGRGALQADLVAQSLAGVDIDIVVTSPRLRCVQTAAAITAVQRRPTSTRSDERLVELGLGAFEGRSVDEIRTAGLGDVFTAWRQGLPPAYPPGAEHFEDAADRMEAVFDEVVRSGAGVAALVGHSHALRMLIATRVLGGSPEMHRRLFLDHASVTTVFWENSTPRLAMLNGSTVGDVAPPPIVRASAKKP